MATNMALDPTLVGAALACGGHTTKRQAVTAALEEYIRQCQVKEFIAAVGTIEWDEDYDYKAERRTDVKAGAAIRPAPGGERLRASEKGGASWRRI